MSLWRKHFRQQIFSKKITLKFCENPPLQDGSIGKQFSFKKKDYHFCLFDQSYFLSGIQHFLFASKRVHVNQLKTDELQLLQTIHNFGIESKIRPTMQVLKELFIINSTICIIFFCHFHIFLCGFKYAINLELLLNSL